MQVIFLLRTFCHCCCCPAKKCNVANFLKGIKDIKTSLIVLGHHDMMQLQDKGYNSESYSFGVMLLFN